MKFSVRRRTSGAIAIALAIAGMVALTGHTPLPASASPGTHLAVGSGSVDAPGAEGTASVSLVLASQDTLGEFDVEVSYNTAVIEVEDADSIVLNPRWDPPTGLPLLIDASTPGLVRVHSTTGDPCPAGSSCPLFSFSWRAVANGTTAISVTSFTLTGTENGQPGVLSGVTVSGAQVTVGAAPSPTVTATFTPTAAATATVATPTATTAAATETPTAPSTATATTVPATVVSPSPSSPARETVAAATANAPSAGNGLSAGPDSRLAQAAMAAFVVAALLAFGWIMSSLRNPSVNATSAGGGGAGGQAPRHTRSRRDIEMDVITDYLRTMEALGMASSDIELDDHTGPTKASQDED